MKVSKSQFQDDQQPRHDKSEPSAHVERERYDFGEDLFTAYLRSKCYFRRSHVEKRIPLRDQRKAYSTAREAHTTIMEKVVTRNF